MFSNKKGEPNFAGSILICIIIAAFIFAMFYIGTSDGFWNVGDKHSWEMNKENKEIKK